MNRIYVGLGLGRNHAHGSNRADHDTGAAVGALVLGDVHPGLVDCNAVSGTYCYTAAAGHAFIVFEIHHLAPNRKLLMLLKRFGMGLGI